jgi:hypothetical protein
MDFLGQTWVQILLVVLLIGIGVWWFKFRPNSY